MASVEAGEPAYLVNAAHGPLTGLSQLPPSLTGRRALYEGRNVIAQSHRCEARAAMCGCSLCHTRHVLAACEELGWQHDAGVLRIPRKEAPPPSNSDMAQLQSLTAQMVSMTS